VSLGGTIVAEGELRTYVTIAAGSPPRPTVGWYAVNEKGGLNAAEIPTGPPTLLLVPAGRDRYRPDDPTGAGPDVTVEFHADGMTVTGPDGTTAARRAG
jgi:hypothetical protein